jgi:hypothetical protein
MQARTKKTTAVNGARTGRIGERLAANELEERGFSVTSLNKEGNAANADLIATKAGKPWQIQVKTTRVAPDKPWEVYLGYTNQKHVDGQGRELYNQHPDGFYRADFVVLVAFKSLKDYRSIVMPVAIAEKLFQIQLDWYWTTPTRKKGTVKVPSRVWVHLDDRAKKVEEREILRQYEDRWDILG